MQRRYVFANHKGGAGKSTATTAFALCAAREGRPVVVVDFDGQGSTTRLIAAASLPLTVHHKLPEPELDCLVFVDTPGLDKQATRRAAACADVLIIPVQMTQPDLEAALLTMAFARDFGRVTCFLPNRLHPHRNSSKPKAINWSLGDLMRQMKVKWPILPGLRDLAGAHRYLAGLPEHERDEGRSGTPPFETDVQASWNLLKDM